jgi:hypothetical protein
MFSEMNTDIPKLKYSKSQQMMNGSNHHLAKKCRFNIDSWRNAKNRNGKNRKGKRRKEDNRGWRDSSSSHQSPQNNTAEVAET